MKDVDDKTDPARADDTVHGLVGRFGTEWRHEMMKNTKAFIIDLAARIGVERDQARQTAADLNRRAQQAEGLVAKFKLVENRPQMGPGRSFGRALANYAASLYMRERDEARALVDGAKPIVELWNAQSPAQIEWKRNWLAKATEALSDANNAVRVK